jgi:hypothetical protein
VAIVSYPVERLFEFNAANRPKAFLDSLLGETQSPEYTISDPESTENLLFVVFTKFPIWLCMSPRNLLEQFHGSSSPSILSPSNANSRILSVIMGSRFSIDKV